MTFFGLKGLGLNTKGHVASWCQQNAAPKIKSEISDVL